MTGKRMKKLLMAKGISRNNAEFARLHIRIYSGGKMCSNEEKSSYLLMISRAGMKGAENG